MIDRNELHPIITRALAADKHDVEERGLEWDPHAAASAVLDSLERIAPTHLRLLVDTSEETRTK